MGMMLFEVILCEKGSKGSFAKLEKVSTFGFRFRYRWKSRKKLWAKACALSKAFVMDTIMVDDTHIKRLGNWTLNISSIFMSKSL
jgi:hypothetical protein